MTEEQAREKIAGIWGGFIADNVREPVLAEVVAAQGVAPDYDTLRAQGPEDADSNHRATAVKVVARYGQALPLLITELSRRFRLDDVFFERLEFAVLAVRAVETNLRSAQAAQGDAAPAEAAPAEDAPTKAAPAGRLVQEAAIATRARFLNNRILRQKLDVFEGRICSLFVRSRDPGTGQVLKSSQGTGFLVGPNLVLTAHHVIAKTAAAMDQVQAGDLYAVFDHLDDPGLKWGDTPPAGAQRIEFAKSWLVAFSPGCPEIDGQETPSAADIAELQNCLDWALIALAKDVGRFVRPSRGVRRQWFELQAPSALEEDSRIIVPQHPKGAPMQIDFGRYLRQDASATRLRYNAEADPGTSGAPCFNEEYGVVGIHSASWVRKDGMADWNQAISLYPIIQQLSPHLPAPGSAAAAAAPKLWNTSHDPAAPEVVLGREPLIRWAMGAARDVQTRSERLYAAIAIDPDQKAGRSYSIAILRALRADAEPVAVLDAGKTAPPQRADDFLRALAPGLGLSQAELDVLPPRPADLSPAGALDGDKLTKWASTDLPRAFEAVLRSHRQPSDGKERWPFAWIVLDGLDRVTLSDEVRSLLAGLVGGLAEEAATPDALRRLRWLFLGRADFLSPQDVSQEVLDPQALGPTEVAEAYARLADAHGRPVGDTELPGPIVSALIKRYVGTSPNRLEGLQACFRDIAQGFQDESAQP